MARYNSTGIIPLPPTYYSPSNGVTVTNVTKTAAAPQPVRLPPVSLSTGRKLLAGIQTNALNPEASSFLSGGDASTNAALQSHETGQAIDSMLWIIGFAGFLLWIAGK